MSKKLKIAIFCNTRGGALKALQNEVKFLKSKGHYIDVYTVNVFDESFASFKEYVNNYYVYPFNKSKIRTFLFSFLNNAISLINIPSYSGVYFSFNDFKNIQKKMANDINEGDYDLVFSDKDSMFTASPFILKYINKPLVYYCHEPIRNEKILKKLMFKQEKFYDKLYSRFIEKKYIELDLEYAKYADYILTNSYYSHENLLRIYGLNSHVSYPGIDASLFYCKNFPRENFILSVGSISEHKGFDFIIRSIGKIDKKIRPKLIITGYASKIRWKNYLIQLAKEEQVELELLEGIPFEELVDLYNKAKLFVFGSYLEPLGLVPLEALSCGTPVVAVKEGGIRETIKHNQNGLLVDRDERLFSEAIVKLLTNDEMWNKFSENGQKYIKNYWDLECTGQILINHFYHFLEEYDDLS